MRLEFLGTSYGSPVAGRQCSCVMLEVGGYTYFVDMGMLAVQTLVDRGMPLDKVKAVFVTHMHGDHVAGLPNFIHMTNGHLRNCNPTYLLPEAEAPEAIRAWLKAIHIDMRDRDFSITREGLTYDDGVVRVTAFRTTHTASSFGYLVEAAEGGEVKRIYFTSDLESPDVDFPKAIYGVPLDLIVVEGSHFPLEQYIPHLMSCNAKRVAVTHYPFRVIPEIIALADAIDDHSKLFTAYDGLVMEI